MQRVKHWLALPLLGLFVITSIWFLYQTTQAEPVRDRVLEDVRITEINGQIAVSIRLPCPFQKLGHFPQEQGKELRIQIQPVPTCNVDRDAFNQRESVRPRHADAAALIAVTYEGDLETGQYLNLSFERVTQWQLQTDSDFRGLTVLLIPLTDANDQ